MGRSYTYQTLLKLAGKSRLFCAKPGCGEYLLAPGTPFDDEALLTNIAHIEGSSDDGPRPNPALTEKQRNHYDNLVLLCPTHHTLVDKQDSTYSVDELRDWKVAIESWVDVTLAVQMKSISFSELQTACDAIISDSKLSSTAMTAVPPADKLKHNSLTSKSENLLRMGLMQEEQVIRFLQGMSQINPNFPNQLRKGFVTRYEALRLDGIDGDDLFSALFIFAGIAAGRPGVQPEDRFLIDAAALAVLSHLFHICDVFEAPPNVDAG